MTSGPSDSIERNSGDSDTVESLWAKAERAPGDVRRWNRLTRSLSRTGDVKGEIAALKRMLQLPQSNSAAVHAQLAALLYKHDRRVEATAHFQAAAAASGNGDGRAEVAKIFGEADKAEHEVELLTHWLNVAGEDTVARGRLVDLLIELDRAVEAVPHLRTLAEVAPGSGHWSRLGRILSDAGDLEGEVEVLERRVETTGGDSAVRSRLVRLLRQLGREADQIPHLRVLAEEAPDVTARWSRLTRALANTGDAEGEIEVLRRRLEVGGEDAAVRGRLARRLAEVGREDETIPHLRTLAESSPAGSPVWSRLTRALSNIGDTDGEIEVLRRRLELAGDDAAVMGRLARLLTQQGRTAEVAALFRARAEGNPGDLAAWKALLGFVASVGDTEQEVSVLGQMAQLEDERVTDFVLDYALDLVKPARSNKPGNAEPQWLHLRSLFSDPRFEALALRHPSKLAAMVEDEIDNPLVDGVIPLLLKLPPAAAENASSPAAAALPAVRSRLQSIHDSPAFGAPVLICGFPHSGTRLVARILEKMGLFVIWDTISHEWRYAKRVNALLLFDHFDEEKIRAFQPDKSGGALNREAVAFRLAAAGYSGAVPWGMKDPRTSLTAEAWLAAFPDMYILNVLRSPLDVVGTLPHDQYSKLTPGGGRPQGSAEIWGERWRLWMERVRETMKRTKRSCEVRFEEVCADPAGAGEYIARSLGLEDSLDADPARSMEIDTSRIGIYRSWIEKGDLAESEIEVLKPLAREYGFTV